MVQVLASQQLLKSMAMQIHVPRYQQHGRISSTFHISASALDILYSYIRCEVKCEMTDEVLMTFKLQTGELLFQPIISNTIASVPCNDKPHPPIMTSTQESASLHHFYTTGFPENEL